MKPEIEEIIPAYKDHLFVAAFNILKNREDAEDVVQDTFVRYYTVSKEFEDEKHVKSWLLRVAINRAKDMLRLFWRRNRCPLDENFMEGAVVDSEDEELVISVLKLPRKYRIVIHLFYYEDYSVKEISEMLKMRENTVKSRLSRGRSLLKGILKEEWNDEEQ